jgi:hypothetical protein
MPGPMLEVPQVRTNIVLLNSQQGKYEDAHIVLCLIESAIIDQVVPLFICVSPAL